VTRYFTGESKKSKRKGQVAKMVAMANREQSLHLFHLMGKVLYNKRSSFMHFLLFLFNSLPFPTGKDDPLNPSATAKDVQRERALDALVKDPDENMLPVWWKAEHSRRSSRVNVDVSGVPSL